ncbi:AAA family ATPase [Texas Phoenix palm phytoplasma]|uniref:DNA 3'-5' helicase n=1 Tax=Texas Phoenix palm phytoplasma TaxID=176709 RepID=A0ABS5BI50_9MOLU|nr:ATP-dependent helicase [Texas Phoenix palm phytoplasma]MBP3059260.1 AAA family ATPase [Texas Phoenix palm phytoplasma]
MNKQEWLNNLNEEQFKSVTVKNKSVYVIAGPGTGKTRTLISRIAYLIESEKTKIKGILVIAFTNNAVQEVKERLEKILHIDDFSILTITTFHSLCNKILRKYIVNLGLQFTSYFSIIDEKDRKKIIRNILSQLCLDKNIYNISNVGKYISYIKNKVIKKEILESYSGLDKKRINNYDTESSFFSKEIEIIYISYNNYLMKNNMLDFDDLIIYTYKLLTTNYNIALLYQNQFSYVLVDEFQDIDLIQYQIMKILSKNSYFFTVGDLNQNIYSFRGADRLCSYLLLKDFKFSKMNLKKNYRSTENILNKANLLIQNNYINLLDDYFKNFLISVSGSGEEVVYQNFFNSQQESEFIVKKIKELVYFRKYKFKDIAILYRMNELSQEIENSFINSKIPYFVNGYVSLYQKKEIKDFIAYLKFIISPEQNFFLKRIINVPSRNIGTKTIDILEKISSEKNISLFEVIKNISNFNLSKVVEKKIDKFKKIFFNLLSLINDKKTNLSNLIFSIDEIIGYSIMLDEKETQDNNLEKKNNLKRLQFIFAKYDSEMKGNFLDKLISLLDQIVLFSDNDISFNKNDQVILSSIHKSKGLEFKVVFVIGWEENIFLNISNLENFGNDFFVNNSNEECKEKNIQEERRLAYVAITRAKELLYISSSNYRFIFGKKIFSKPISFIQEMKLIDSNKKTKNNFLFYKNRNYKKYSLYNIGEKVQHDFFGLGTIISLNNEIATILFSKPYGMKQILINHFSLKKID